jgi:hypothetical protein
MSNEVGSDETYKNKILIQTGVKLSRGIGYYTIIFPDKGINTLLKVEHGILNAHIWEGK